MFLHLKHLLKKDGKLSLPVSDRLYFPEGKRTPSWWLVGLACTFCRCSGLGEGGREISGIMGNLPSLPHGASWSLSMISVS